MKPEKKVILLAGPTASGKSKLAIKLAKYFHGEIINADSMQIYKEISILTSRPTSFDTNIIKHHLYGFCSVKKNFSTGDWLELVIKKIKEQWNKEAIPIVVGGTGLYFKVLTDGLAIIPNIPTNLRKKIRNLQKEIGQKLFFEKLIKFDSLAKKFILPTDSQRSIRAYEVKKFTNKSLFELTKSTATNFDKKIFKKFFVNISKELLHKKIDSRVEKMFEEGVVEEIKNFLKMRVNKESSSFKVIGIKEIKEHLEGKITLATAKELIKQKTRQYAKRQFTWARGNMKSWDMIYSHDINDLFRKVINKIS